jgi:hypothetical protein
VSLPHDTPFEASILADDTGRRRLLLRRGARALAALLVLWLVVLALGGLGLEPLGGLPNFGAATSTPPALPERVQAAVAQRRVVRGAEDRPPAGTPAAGTAQTAPAATTPRTSGKRLRKPVKKLHTPSQAKTPTTVVPAPLKANGKGVATAPGQVTKTTTTTAPKSTGKGTTTQGSTTAPGQTKTTTSPTSTPNGNGTPGGGQGHTTTTTP